MTVLSPHQDDAAFSLGLSIATWLAAGHAVRVVNCFTRSRYSPFGDLDFVHPNDLQSYVTALRHREDLRWSRKYHPPVELKDLNLRDAPQRLQCTVDEVCRIAPRLDDGAIAKIQAALAKSPIDALVLPLGIGNHVDHLTARIAAQGIWPQDRPTAFYEDLPEAAGPGAAETIATQASSVADGLEAGFAEAPAEPAAAIARKRDLALCYDSQIDSKTTELIARFCERHSGRERLWFNRAWSNAAITTHL